jgi:ribonuclease VapC
VIIDTSALVAILDQEPEAARIVRTLASAPERTLSAANLVEAGIVVQARRGDDGAGDLDLLLAKLRVDIAAVTASQADIISALWLGTTPGQSQFWRLFCLRPGEGQVGPTAV